MKRYKEYLSLPYEHIEFEEDENGKMVYYEDAKEELNKVYNERNRVVAALANAMLLLGYDVYRTKTEIEGWDPEWYNCVYISLPTGQASWHYHDDEKELFDFIIKRDVEWDGHSTEEKYERLNDFAHENYST